MPLELPKIISLICRRAYYVLTGDFSEFYLKVIFIYVIEMIKENGAAREN